MPPPHVGLPLMRGPKGRRGIGPYCTAHEGRLVRTPRQSLRGAGRRRDGRSPAGPGEVRIRVRASAINPGEVGKRSGVGAPMPFPRVIPHSDGAGTIDAVGPGVPSERVGERVWCFHAQSYRPFGTAAELTVV